MPERPTDAFSTDAEEHLDRLTGEHYEVDDEDTTELFAAFVERNPEAFLC